MVALDHGFAVFANQLLPLCQVVVVGHEQTALATMDVLDEQGWVDKYTIQGVPSNWR